MPKVSLADHAQIFEISSGEILYDSLADRGLELPHGCLSGSCGACRVQIIEGSQNLMPPGFVEQDTISALKVEFVEKYGKEFVEKTEIRLSCRAKVLGDVLIKHIK